MDEIKVTIGASGYKSSEEIVEEEVPQFQTLAEAQAAGYTDVPGPDDDDYVAGEADDTETGSTEG